MTHRFACEEVAAKQEKGALVCTAPEQKQVRVSNEIQIQGRTVWAIRRRARKYIPLLVFLCAVGRPQKLAGTVGEPKLAPTRLVRYWVMLRRFLYPSPPGPLSHKGRGEADLGRFRNNLSIFARIANFFVLFRYCSCYLRVRFAVADKPYNFRHKCSL